MNDNHPMNGAGNQVIPKASNNASFLLSPMHERNWAWERERGATGECFWNNPLALSEAQQVVGSDAGQLSLTWEV